MRKEFEELVKWAHTEYLTSQKINEEQLSDKFEERREFWETKITESDKIDNLINPYFIGYGNTESKTLIIGKELGFNINDQHQMIRESIDNTYQWSQIIQDNIVEIPYLETPKLPYGGIQDDFASGHTWRLYRKFLSNLENEHQSNSAFLDKAFLTEFNYAPSAYSPGNIKLDSRRKPLLAHPFFKGFQNILLTYRSYDKHKENQGLTEKLFDVEYKDQGSVGRQVYLKFTAKNRERTVILTNQLSGSAGWSDRELEELAGLFK